MRPSHFSLALAVLALAGSSVAVAQDGDPDQGGAAFLLFPVGGRASALGQAAAADAGSSEAAFWNPAGLAVMEHGEVAAHHAATFVSNNTALSVMFKPSTGSTVGISAYLVDFGSQEVVPPGGPVTGKFSPKNVELLASYATTLAEPLTFGVNYKLIQFRQDCSGDCGVFPDVVGTTHGFDVGMQLGIGGTTKPLRFGVALRHMGFKLQLEDREQADPLPTRWQAGFAYHMILPPPAPEAEPLDVRVLVDLQDDWDSVDSPDARVGVELGYGDFIMLRTGYAFLVGEARGPSVGLGLRLGRVALDFSRIFFVSSNFDEPVYISLRAGL